MFSQIVNVDQNSASKWKLLIVGRLSLNPPSFLPVIHPVRDAISTMLMTAHRFQLWRVNFARPDMESKDSEAVRALCTPTCTTAAAACSYVVCSTVKYATRRSFLRVCVCVMSVGLLSHPYLPKDTTTRRKK
jgi:hypothetical protein